MTEFGLIKPATALEPLDDYELASADLNFEYWTPAKDDKKRVLYSGTEIRRVPDHADKTRLVDLEVVVLLDPKTNRVYVNGSAILRTTCEQLEKGTPIQIVYLGKKPARSGNQCDNWSVQALAKKGSK
ncbi:MAG: hypothetical protein ABGZ35_23685 [Planctomycetaceae bacterium]